MQDDICYYYRISNDTSFAASKSNRIWSASNTVINSLSAGSSYYVQIGTSATKSNTTAPADVSWSSPIEVTTAPERVDSNSVKEMDATETSMTIEWEASAGANYYEISYWLQNEKEESAATVSANTNRVTIAGLEKNSKYNVKIHSYRMSTGTGYKAGLISYGYKYGMGVVPSKVTGVENTTFYPYINTAYFEWDAAKSADGYQYIIYSTFPADISK